MCDSCGQDHRTFLQRILPVSINVKTNHKSEYRSFFLGWQDLQDIRSADRLIDFNDGWMVGFTRGKRFCNNIRIEREVTIRHTTPGDYNTGAFVGDDFVPAATFDAFDSLFAISSMRNLIYDFNGLGTRITPYAGIGLGGLYVTGDIVTPDLGRAEWINDSAFAYQFIVGATRKISDRTEAFAEFRHYGTSGLELENDAGDPVIDFPFQNNSIIAGIRINMPRRGCCQ